MTANELIEAAVKLGDAALKKGEMIRPTCYVHLTWQNERKLLALDYDAAPHSAERAFKQYMIITAIRAFRAVNSFDGAVLVSEAWLKRMPIEQGREAVKKGGYDKIIADDPERVDSFIAMAYGRDGSRRFVGWELKPTKKKGVRYRAPETVMDSEGEGGYTTEGWMDRAFHDDHEGEA